MCARVCERKTKNGLCVTMNHHHMTPIFRLNQIKMKRASRILQLTTGTSIKRRLGMSTLRNVKEVNMNV